MSLVVARRIGSQVRIIGDSRVSYPDGIQSNLLRGVLKIVTVRKDLCLAFAGPIRPALDLLREVHKSHDDAVDIIRARNIGGNLNCLDLIVADLTNRDAPLARIAAGVVEIGPSSTWIGDVGAFSAFQEAYAAVQAYCPSAGLSPQENAFMEETRKMDTALGAVLQSGKHHSVGDFKIAVSGSLGGVFRYDIRAEGYNFRPVSNTTEERSLTQPVSMEEGGYYFSILSPSQAGDAAIGAYFPQGRFGVLMHPLALDQSRNYSNVSMDGFREAVRTEWGLDLVGIYPPGA